MTQVFLPGLFLLGIVSFAAEPASFPVLDFKAPPLGLKSYIDLGLISDENITAQSPSSETKGVSIKPQTPGSLDFPLPPQNCILRLSPENNARTLVSRYSKDNGVSWSEPRFLLQLDGEKRSINAIRMRKVYGNVLQVDFSDGQGRRLRVEFPYRDLPKFATAADIARVAPGKSILDSRPAPNGLARRITLGGTVNVSTDRPPAGFIADSTLGLLVPDVASGQVIHTAIGRYVFESRGAFTPDGSLFVMFPDGGHASSPTQRNNKLLAAHSADGGKTWTPAVSAFGDKEKHFGPVFAKTSDEPKRVYAFATLHIEGVTYNISPDGKNLPKGRAFGFRFTDDNGKSWSAPQAITRTNGLANSGVGVIQMAVTPADTFLIGFHSSKILRGALVNGVREWTQVTPPRLNSSPESGDYMMNELRIIQGANSTLAFARTQEGRLWKSRSTDDGKTWENFSPTPLVHCDSPPMLFHLSDGKTIVALIHNRANLRSVHEPSHSQEWTMPMPSPEQVAKGNRFLNSYRDWAPRAELWASLSVDDGETWSEPRFLLANALPEMLAETLDGANRNYNLSYTDLVARDGTLHLFIPHRWRRILHVSLPESVLRTLPTHQELQKTTPAIP